MGQEAGVIEGALSLRPGPQGRWPSRYPGAGPTSAKVHPVPAVVYLLGDFPEEDSVTAVRDIVQRDGVFIAEYVLLAGTETHYTFRGVEDGETLHMGNTEVEVLHTPGHTPEHQQVLT